MAWHNPIKVLALVGKNSMIFDSINEACDYFSDDDHMIKPEQLRRIIQGTGIWQYHENGRLVEVTFDELFE